MSDLGNKEIFSKNLKRYMNQKNINTMDLSKSLNQAYSTVADWVKGNSYPRIDKIEMLANYFRIEKSDLIEDKSIKEPPSELSQIPGVKIIKRFVNVPVLGEIACGEPIFCQQNYEGFFQIDEDLARPDFCVTAKGDSMLDVGIQDGDLIFLKETPIVENGKIAAVLIEDTVTLKRFYKNEKEIVLQPENKTYSPIIIREGDGQNIRILGEMVGMYSKGSK